MKFQKPISILVLCIAALSLVATAVGIFSSGGPGPYEFKTLHGETVTIYGKGLYQYEAARLGPQARAQDVVTMFLGIPLLIIALFWSRKGSLKGRLVLTGTLGYFLYMYTQYTSIAYNKLFLIYVMLMAASLYAFILAMMSFDMKGLGSYFNDKMPIRFISGFQIFIAFTLIALWMGDLVPSLLNGTVPKALLHYSSLPVYSMDLGLVVPTCVVSAILLLKRNPFGYLLSSVIIIKSITMLTALTAMGVGAVLEGVQVSLGEMAIFPTFNLVAIYAVWLLLKNIDDKGLKRDKDSEIFA